VQSLDDEERRRACRATLLKAPQRVRLRDNMKFRLEDCVQRDHSLRHVDEADSILVDEARSPLIVSGPGEESTCT
jgi:preprotein translocase subunit SecA